jgi:hypothetical protein
MVCTQTAGTALTHRSSAEASRLLPRGLETPPSKAAVAQQAGGDPWSSSAGSEDDDDGCSLSLSLALDTRSSRSGDEVGRLSPTATASSGRRISLDLSLSTL